MKIIHGIRNFAMVTLHHWGTLRALQFAKNFPGFNIDRRAEVNAKGSLLWGEECSIGAFSRVVVPKDAALTFGNRSWCGQSVELHPSSDGIHIGHATSIQDRCIFYGSVRIGSYCLFAPNVYISSGRHHFDDEPVLLIRDQDELARNAVSLHGKAVDRPVVIHDDCWIGINVVIMPGVKIGKGSVIGANSVVTSDIPPYSVAVGSPARVIRQRLPFVPGASLNAARPADHPYFYSGFGLLRADLARSSAGTVLARRQFSVAINKPENARELTVFARALPGIGKARLLYDSKSVELSQDIQPLVFPCSESSFEHVFKVESEQPGVGLDPFVIEVQRVILA